jgi:hypothetical protein
LHARISGTVAGPVTFTRDVSFGVNERIVKVTDTINNYGIADVPSVATLDSLDPDQGADGTPTATYFTYNDVASVVMPNDTVVAVGTNNNLSLLMGSESGMVIPSAIGFDNRDAYSFLSVVDPDGAPDDIAINLAQDYGTLGAGQSRSVTWFMVFGTSYADVTNAYHGGVMPKLELMPISLQGCTFTFSLNGPAGTNYVLQAGSTLTSWVSLVTNSLPPSGSVVFVDTDVCNRNTRFFRAQFVTPPPFSAFGPSPTNGVIYLPPGSGANKP